MIKRFLTRARRYLLAGVLAPLISLGAMTATANELVNVNTASAEEIAAVLDGVGLKRAEAIVEYRERYGAFTSADELMAVSGIGERVLEVNRPRIQLD